jgi:hypothetical protein
MVSQSSTSNRCTRLCFRTGYSVSRVSFRGMPVTTRVVRNTQPFLNPLLLSRLHCFQPGQAKGVPRHTPMISPTRFSPAFIAVRANRRKIGNAKCRHLKKLAFRGTLQQVFICLRPSTPYPPPLHTVYTVYSILVHTGN